MVVLGWWLLFPISQRRGPISNNFTFLNMTIYKICSDPRYLNIFDILTILKKRSVLCFFSKQLPKMNEFVLWKGFSDPFGHDRSKISRIFFRHGCLNHHSTSLLSKFHLVWWNVQHGLLPLLAPQNNPESAPNPDNTWMEWMVESTFCESNQDFMTWPVGGILQFGLWLHDHLESLLETRKGPFKTGPCWCESWWEFTKDGHFATKITSQRVAIGCGWFAPTRDPQVSWLPDSILGLWHTSTNQ